MSRAALATPLPALLLRAPVQPPVRLDLLSLTRLRTAPLPRCRTCIWIWVLVTSRCPINS